MMKIKIVNIIASLLLFSLVHNTSAETNFYIQVKTLWFAGEKQAVLDIAKARLAINSNDLAGLFLKAEYEMEFLQLDDMTQTWARAIAAGTQYSGSNFMNQLPLIKMRCAYMAEIVTNYPPDELVADRAKATLPRKTMGFDAVIQALQEDGYFKTRQPGGH